MSHEISVTGRHAHMAYTREVPWHGLGVRVPEDATPTEAAAAARLDWRVLRAPLRLEHTKHGPVDTGSVALVRQDLWQSGRGTAAVFGTATSDYEPVQNATIARALDALTSQPGVSFDTAGALGHGQRSWFMVRLAGTHEIASNDVVEMYLLLVNRFDLRCVEARLTPVRVVCANTLSLSVMFGGTMQVPHSGATQEVLETVSKGLRRVHRNARNLTRQFVRMARTPISEDQLDAMIENTIPARSLAGIPEIDHEIANTRRYAKLLFESGTGNANPDVAGSVWAALNGITEYLDHRHMDRVDRLESNWFGSGHHAKLRAMQFALSLIGHRGRQGTTSRRAFSGESARTTFVRLR